LGSNFLSNQLLLCGSPNREYAADRKVSVNDGAAVKGIKSDVETLALTDDFKVRSLLACKPFDFGVLLEVLLNDLITLDILMELLVSEFVGRAYFIDGRVSNEERDLFRGTEYALEDGGFLAL
jgi:hypothetical protein